MKDRYIKGDRPTIGVLSGWSARESVVPDYYLTSVFGGIQSAARIKGCHLMLAWGIGRVTEATNTYPAWPEVAPESDFVPVGPWNTDGLIVFAPLRSESRSNYIQDLIGKGHPILFIAPGKNGPTISVDSEKGIRLSVEHLIGHGHRQIAFIAGSPTEQGDSESRLNAYRITMAVNNLEVDPKLIAWGWHTVPGGFTAMQELLVSGKEFSAVVASNDNSAVGAMQAIREAGLRIPDDIAIIGFDDQPDAGAQTPPLATVHVPLGMIGEQALAMMFDHLTQQVPLESLKIPTRLIQRRSCGCIAQSVYSATSEPSHRLSARQPRGIDVKIQAAKTKLVDEMLAVLPSEFRFPGGDRFLDAITILVDGFYGTLEKGDSTHFQKALMTYFNKLDELGDTSAPWQEMISVLRQGMTRVPINWGGESIYRLAEDMLHQARVAVGENALRIDQRHEYQRDIASRSLGELTAHLSALLDRHQAVEFLNAHLAEVGIKHSKVVLFEPTKDDPVAESVVLNQDIEAASLRFQSREFPPRGLYPCDEVLSIALFPLVFQNEALGYVAFDTGDLETCAVIATQLAATIKTSQLYAQITELSLTDSLTGLYNRRYFELFLTKEVSRHQRFAHGLAIIMLDVDNFKQYNDSFGHPAGDKALKRLAKCLSDDRRDTDLVARIGGDEFVLILPETDLTGAKMVVSKIHDAIARLVDVKRPITVSMGLTVLREQELDAETLVKQADIALYRAKRTGRNCTILFEELESQVKK